MAGVIRRLKHLQLAMSRRHESLLLQGIGPLEAYKPVYEKKPAWSARWTYPLIFMQIGVSCALTELIVNHWTERVTPPDPDEALAQTDQSTANDTTERREPENPEYALRPLWQRVSAAFGQFCVGAFICVVLLNSRSRIIQRLYLLPSSVVTPTSLSPKLPKGGRESQVLVAQNVYHFRGQGNVFPLSETRLTAGFDKNELAFTASGVWGKFYLGLQNATVNGQQQPIWQTKEALFRLWYGSKSKNEMGKIDWIE